MPWTRKQYQVAQAVVHGWKPTGSAKGFTKSFAQDLVSEWDQLERSKSKKKKKS
jgi:hypothetical protein